MNDTDRLSQLAADNDRSLKKLLRAIANSQGNFALILVRCNYTLLAEQVLKRLEAICPLSLGKLYLPGSVETLYTTLQTELGGECPPALLVFGLESASAIDRMLTSTNQVREEFRKHFPFPVVLWVNDDLLQKLTRFAPDFKSWAAIPIKFEMPVQVLLDGLQRTMDSAFAALLEVGAGKFIDSASIALPAGSLRLAELETALGDLERCGERLEPELEANLRFLIGRKAELEGDRQKARRYYECSWQCWQNRVNLEEASGSAFERYGCLLFHLGLWWRQEAIRNRTEYEAACQKAREYYRHCVGALRRSDRPELEQRFINALGEVLTRLEAWEELKATAERAVSLHRTQQDSVRLAYGYGLLAEVALHEGKGEEAKGYAELALRSNEEPSTSTGDWSWNRQHYCNYYRLLLARSQRQLGREEEAIAHLEVARAESFPESDPLLYIGILENLRSLQFERGEYLEAFKTKQEQQSIEQQYGLRAFVGAGRLQARRQVVHPAIASPSGAHPEIAASGRLNDVKRLVERICRTDRKLTIIHGQSGVGKSSLVQAGLMPALRQMAIEARDVLPVLLQVYSDWAQNLGASYAQSYREVRGLSLPVLLDSMAAFLEEIRRTSDRNLLTVLIFDQFEEFFFAYTDPSQRRPFFEFLRDCLDTPYVKVILSLREDYLHYLLECNRLVQLNIINNNILDKGILYYLGNFSPKDAKTVIETLTRNAQFYLDSDLLEALVRDLAGELEEVRPIELQVVGAQLQGEKITTLVQYRDRGPKEALVERFLDEIVKDCGPNNKNFVKIILYLLTDENNTRPLKTRAELEAELSIESERLDSILDILVRSGLVFQVPGFPDGRYQLVHDYLVPFIRQRQAATLVAELEKEREQRKLTEAKLNQALKRQLKTSRRAGVTLATLLVAITGFAAVATVAGINLYISNLVSESSKNTGIDRLISAIRAGKRLAQFPVGIPGLQLQTTAELNNAISNLDELNRLEGHEAGVTKVTFSPNGKSIASADENNTVKIWNLEGEILATLTGHTDKIVGINFSSDARLIASASEDKTIGVWTVQGQKIKTLELPNAISSVGFSADNQKLATPSGKTIILWDISSGKSIKTISGHEAVITSTAFSPDGQIIAAADRNDTVKLWSLDGRELQSIENYGTIDIRFSAGGKMLILVSQDRSIKYYLLDGTLVKNAEFRGNNGEIEVSSLRPDGELQAYVGRYNTEQIGLIYEEGFSIGTSFKHSDLISDLSFSPDGKILASASQDKTIRLWNLSLTSGGFNWDNSVDRVQFNRDGSTIAAARSDNTIQLLDKQGKLRKTLAANGSILQFDPSGKVLVTGSAEDVIKLRHLNGQSIVLRGHPNGIVGASISPDGKRIVSVGYDGVLNFWDSDGQLIKTQDGQSLDTRWTVWYEKKNSLQFSPDSQRIAVITENNRVQLWTRDGNLLGILKGHTSEIYRVRFSPDSQQIATIGDDNFVHLYTRNGKKIGVLKGHKNQVSDVKFSPNSAIIASTSQSTIKLWQRDGSFIRNLNGRGIQTINFSPDSTIIAASTYYDTVQLWSIDGREIATLLHNGEVTDVSFSPDGEILASASADNLVRLWRKDGTPIKKLRGHLDTVNQVIFSPNGQTLASLSDDGTVRLWTREGTSLKTLQPASEEDDSRNTDREDRIEFSKDGRVIALMSKVNSQGESNSTIRLWDSQDQKLKTFQTQEDLDLDDIAFSAESKTLMAVEHDPTLKMWGVDGSSLATFQGHRDRVTSASFSSDGTILATASDDKTVKLWNRNGQLLKTLDHEDKVNSVSFSPDSQIWASASDDKTVKLWNRNGQLLKTLDHEDTVNRVNFSPNGKILASASDDKTVKLWNQDGRFLKKLEHPNEVKDIRFRPDSKAIASVTEDNTIKLWRIRDRKELIKPIEKGNNVLTIPGFSPDGKLLTTASSNSLQFSILSGVWFKDAELSSTRLANLNFSVGRATLAVKENKGVSIVDLELDPLLARACDLARNYLTHSTELKERDRRLCDGIPPHK